MLTSNLARGVRLTSQRIASHQTRSATTASQSQKYKVLVVGGGTAGLAVARQVYDRFKAAGKSLKDGDIGIVDAAETHYYQPGWTLVGCGLRSKTDFARPLKSLIPGHISLISENVKSFSPSSSYITTTSGRDIGYDVLVVAAGLQTNFDAIEGLPGALDDPSSGVSTIYSYKTCEKVWTDIESLKSGNAIFTQPPGIIKCAGAPQKILWMAWDRFRRTGRGGIKVDFYTGMPSMFSVKKYSDALNALREERGVGGYFGHELVSIDAVNRQATFRKVGDKSAVKVDYSLLHVTPPMGPLNVFKGSPIADATGWVPVNQATLQHVKPEFGNVFAIGDCSSLPTSKTAAAITAQAPVLTENLFSFVDTGKVADAAKYDGYTSCPLLTGYGELMLAEFKYGLEPKETFAGIFDQAKSNRFFYHLKKDIFPYAYWNYMVNGQWFGSKGLSRPAFH